MDIPLEHVQGWVWEWEEHAWGLFGWQSSWRSKAENNWTRRISPDIIICTFFHRSVSNYVLLTCDTAFAEHSCCFKVLLKDYLEETCRASVSECPGLLLLICVYYWDLSYNGLFFLDYLQVGINIRVASLSNFQGNPPEVRFYLPVPVIHISYNDL